MRYNNDTRVVVLDRKTMIFLLFQMKDQVLQWNIAGVGDTRGWKWKTVVVVVAELLNDLFEPLQGQRQVEYRAGQSDGAKMEV